MQPQTPITDQEYADAMQRASYWACRIAQRESDREELRSVGNWAIMRAAQKFSREGGASFVTFATFYIRKHQGEAFRELLSPVSYDTQKARQFGREDIADFANLLPAPAGEQNDRGDAGEVLGRALAALKPYEAKLIRDYHIEGMALAEMGKYRRLTKQGVARHLRNAEKALKAACSGLL